MCTHTPNCPPVTSPDHAAARVVAAHPEQGWSLLCNGAVLFDDYGELLPDGRALPSRSSMPRGGSGAGRRIREIEHAGR
jgi:Family of unknown function (DUF5999)